MATTPTQRADLYAAAIEEILTGKVQSYSVGGRTFTMLDLDTLETLEAYWRAKATAETGGEGWISYVDLSVGG